MHLGWELVSKSKREKAEKRLDRKNVCPEWGKDSRKSEAGPHSSFKTE